MDEKFEWPCRERRGEAHGPHEGTAYLDDMPDGSLRVAQINCPGVKAHPATMIGGRRPEEEWR